MRKRQNRLALHRETLTALSGLGKVAGGDCTCTCCPTACGGVCPTESCYCSGSCDTCDCGTMYYTCPCI